MLIEDWDIQSSDSKRPKANGRGLQPSNQGVEKIEFKLSPVKEGPGLSYLEFSIASPFIAITVPCKDKYGFTTGKRSITQAKPKYCVGKLQDSKCSLRYARLSSRDFLGNRDCKSAALPRLTFKGNGPAL